MDNKREKLDNFRAAAREELGLPASKPYQLELPAERPFLASERSHVTVLFGGLTSAHDTILKGVLEGLGYMADHIPVPDNKALSLGREYCNRGQCNPAYYTIGNLIKYLGALREKGVENVEDNYVFITIGSCGPCRLGMYEEEYRKALRAAGFENFRVIFISQSGDVGSEIEEEAGINMDKKFYVSLVKGVMSADMINEMTYKIRPYEVNEGDCNGASAEAVDILYRAFREKKSVFLALRRAGRVFGDLEVDYTRLKPKVKIIGEFWAQTTEGEGNYRLQEWLEKEGCEVNVEPVSVMVHYTIWYWKEYLWDRVVSGIPFKRRYVLFSGYIKLTLVDMLFRFYYQLYRIAMGLIVSPLPSQAKLAAVVKDYFNTRITGGEGHLEIAKNLIAIKEKKAHLVISVKPFGCMPSTQCDGVQVKVMSDYKEGLFIPIETSGDGEVNVKSRVQMKLHEAREKAKDEFSSLLSDAGICMDSLKKLASSRSGRASRVLKLPSRSALTAGNYLLHLTRKGS